MINVRPIHADEIAPIHFNPKTGKVEATQGAILYIDFTSLEQDEYAGSRKLPLTLKLFFKSVMGFFDGKLKIVSFDFPGAKAITIPTPVKYVQVNRKEMEKYLKENKDSDTIILVKSDQSKDGIRQYGVANDREDILADHSTSKQPDPVPILSARDYFYSNMADKKL